MVTVNLSTFLYHWPCHRWEHSVLNGNLPGARLEAGHFLLRILLNLYDAFVLTVSLAQCIDEVSVVRVRVSYFK